MEFFNKKEDVIDLELTPYGESLLSQGDFKPEFYAFFDDEILYDSKWAGVTATGHVDEIQNEIKGRIKETPRLKTQYLFTNTELRNIELFGEDQSEEKAGMLSYPPKAYIKQYALPWPLGNSSFNSEKAPAWDINLLYNNITGSTGYFSSSMHPYLKIPQLNVIIQYETEALPLNIPPRTSEDNNKKAENLRLKEFDELHENPPLYEDGYYDFQEDFIVLEVNEHNVPYLKDNFDIEVYEILTDKTEKYDTILDQKYFIKKPTIVNEKGLLRSEKEIIRSNDEDLELKLIPFDKSYINSFLNIYVDHEIEKDLMCQLKPDVKQKGYFTSDPLDCTKDDEVNILSSDIYKETSETTPECD